MFLRRDMKEYIFEKVSRFPETENEWKKFPEAKIDCFDFSPDAVNPTTSVRGVYNETGLSLRFESDEKNALARYHGVNEKPWTDSCVEVFFNPCPERSDKYFNFELSAGGGLLVGYGKDRHERIRCDFTPDIFDIKTEITENGWTASLTIPFEFVLRYAPEFDGIFAGNFQKCGDETASPHFPVWNKIESPSPDFHRPECFGKFILGGY